MQDSGANRVARRRSCVWNHPTRSFLLAAFATASAARRCSTRRSLGAGTISILGRTLFLVGLLAADGLELGEHGIDVEIVALFLRRLELRLLAGGLGGRQQRRATMADVGRLLLGRALHLEVEFDLRAEAERYRVHRGQGRGVPVGAVADARNRGLGGADQ